MPVGFIVGRAGSGKSRRCRDAIVAALRADPLGPPIYWLVPRQATFTTQRDLACGSDLSGYWRARVLSFDELGEEVIASSGGAAVPAVNALGRRMILGHLLRTCQPKLKFFAGAADPTALAARIDTALAEFQRCGNEPADLQPLLAGLEPSPLRDKLHDVQLLYQAYSDFLGPGRLDQHLRMMQVLSAIEHSPLFRDAEVYVDGFVQFTEFERRMIAMLGLCCRQVHVMLLMDPAAPILSDPHLLPDDLDLFHPVQRTFRKLYFTLTERNVPVDWPVTLLTETHRFVTPALAAVERGLFAAAAGRTDSLGVEIVEAATARDEVDACCVRILDWINQGLRYRDIAVIVRDLEPYQVLIDAAFREHRIPYFADRRRSTGHHPLVQFVGAALHLASGLWPHDWMMTLLKSGLAGPTPDEADELENYVLRHRLRGVAWVTEGKPPPQPSPGVPGEGEGGITPRAVVDPLLPLIRAFSSATPLTVRRMVGEIHSLLDRFKISATLRQWISDARAAGRLEQAEEHEQVWTGMVELLDQLTDLLGDQPMTLDDFREVLESGLEAFDLGLVPPSVDEVLVGQIDRTRTPQVQAVLILGLTEGLFPRAPQDDSIFSDAERSDITRHHVDLDPDTTRKLLDENYLGYVAFTRASHFVYASRALADESGKPLAESVFLRRLRRLFPALPALAAPRSIATPRQLSAALMQWVRIPGDDPSGTLRALYHWLATTPREQPVSAARAVRDAWRALSYHNHARLDPNVAARLFSSPLVSSVSRLETFAACPFRHWARDGLGLTRRPDDDVSALDLGQVYHRVMEGFVARMIRRRENWSDLDDARRDQLLHDLALDAGTRLRDQIMIGTARARYILRHIETTLRQIIDTQKDSSRRGRFRPAFASIAFGRGAALEPLTLITPLGHELILEGHIDRVDILQDQSACAVVDYKLGGDELSLAYVYHGLSLQLLTYLLVLQANGAALAGRPLTPAAAFYVKLLRRLEDVDDPSQAVQPGDPLFNLQVQPRGIFDMRYLAALDETLVAGSSHVVYASIKKDGKPGAHTDGADPRELAALLHHVRHKLTDLADQIISGQIAVRPYRIGSRSPCPNCEFRSLCRFDPAADGYRMLQAKNRKEILAKVVSESGSAP